MTVSASSFRYSAWVMSNWGGGGGGGGGGGEGGGGGINIQSLVYTVYHFLYACECARRP